MSPFNEAVEGVQRWALRVNPHNADAHFGLGRLLHERGDHAGAEKSYRSAIRCDANHAGISLGSPRLARAHAYLGRLLMSRHDDAGAETSFRSAIRIDPECAAGHRCLGTLLRELGDKAGAEQSFRVAARAKPYQSLNHFYLGRVLMERGDDAGAEASLRKALWPLRGVFSLGAVARARAQRYLAQVLDQLSDDEVPHEFRCSLSLERFRDPVMLAQSGHTYEREHLYRALEERPDVDPLTNAPFEGEPQIAPNRTLKRAVTSWFDEWVSYHEANQLHLGYAFARRYLSQLLDDEVPHGFRCTLSLERFRDPWILLNSGNTYEIEHLLCALHAHPQVDPQTNEPFEGAPEIVPNLTLKRAVIAWHEDWIAQRSA